MRLKKINSSILILSGLLLLSFAFLSIAQEQSTTNNNVFLDSDQDGLTNAEEKIYGTNPQNRDSDEDGYSDGAEIKSGYDPTKPAPGDKLVISEKVIEEVLGTETKKNMTEDVAQKISAIREESQDEEDQNVTLDQIQSLVDESLNTVSSEDILADLPEIKKEDLKIKKQNYNKLSKEDEKKKKKEDFTSYISAVYYILASNSPRPITSNQDITTITAQISQDIIKALTIRDTSSLEELHKSGENILEQLKEVTVPEELVDTHIKAIQMAYCARELEEYIQPNTDDPLKDIANFSKIQGFVSLLMSFSQDTQKKFAEYELEYNDPDIQKKLKDYGIELPEELDASE